MLLTFLVRRRVALGLTMMAACGLPFDPAAAEEQTSSWSWLAHGRTRFESAADSLYGTGRDGEDALYQRLHVGAEYRSDVFETRVTLNLHGQSGLDNPGPKDRGPADLQDAYIGFHLGDGLFNARIGRQAIRFGKKRFVDTSNSSNQRAAFDGIDLNLRSDNRELRAFVVQPLLHQADEAFDDKADDRIRLAVVQGSWDNRSEGGSLWEIYGLRYRRDRGSFDDVRRSLGIRQVGT
ncbi:MAG: alginate export family protein, partial [Xanthomonadales bacterium]|nr:alginate export family protein [Xanthomonadales bacterium]